MSGCKGGGGKRPIVDDRSLGNNLAKLILGHEYLRQLEAPCVRGKMHSYYCASFLPESRYSHQYIVLTIILYRIFTAWVTAQPTECVCV